MVGEGSVWKTISTSQTGREPARTTLVVRRRVRAPAQDACGTEHSVFSKERDPGLIGDRLFGGL